MERSQPIERSGVECGLGYLPPIMAMRGDSADMACEIQIINFRKVERMKTGVFNAIDDRLNKCKDSKSVCIENVELKVENLIVKC